MIVAAETEIRTLYDGEKLPGELNTGFEAMPLTPDWVWVVERECRITAALLAAPVHGLVFISRLVSNGPAYDMVPLLRRFIRDISDRGFPGYFCPLDEQEPEEQTILSIVKRAGGDVYPRPMTFVYGKTAEARKW